MLRDVPCERDLAGGVEGRDLGPIQAEEDFPNARKSIVSDDDFTFVAARMSQGFFSDDILFWEANCRSSASARVTHKAQLGRLVK